MWVRRGRPKTDAAVGGRGDAQLSPTVRRAARASGGQRVRRSRAGSVRLEAELRVAHVAAVVGQELAAAAVESAVAPPAWTRPSRVRRTRGPRRIRAPATRQ